MCAMPATRKQMRARRTALRYWLLFWTAVVVGGILYFVPPRIDEMRNPLVWRPPYEVSSQARTLNNSLTLVDLHADTLLWRRNLLVRNPRGHVDLPRLQEANIALQAFTVVTKAPRGQNIESTSDSDDLIKYLSIVDRWPPNTWFSPRNRALYEAKKLQRFAERSNGELRIIRSQADLDQLLADRKAGKKVVGGLLGLEGAHALEGDLANIDRLYDAGFRMMAPTHFFDNEIAGAASGVYKSGLTPLGSEFVRYAQSRHILIDLAHASPTTIDDVVAITTTPVIVSHTGVRGTCDNSRNLTDDQLQLIASTGGVVGIGYWDTATCGNDAAAIVKAMLHAINLIGADYIALGSDFDGDVTAPFDVTGTALITDELQKAGVSERDIRKIMGENALRVLRQVLPAR